MWCLCASTGALWATSSDANRMLGTVGGLKAVMGTGRVLGQKPLSYSSESMTLVSQVRGLRAQLPAVIPNTEL